MAAALSDLGLTELDPSSLPIPTLQAAVQQVLWSGGDRAWGPPLYTALRAQHVYRRGVDYIVRDERGKGKVCVCAHLQGEEGGGLSFGRRVVFGKGVGSV